MMKFQYLLLTLVGCFFCVGCDMMDYHPYDTRFDGERNINATNIKRIERATKNRKELCFAVISDTQRWYDDTHDIVDHINAMEGIDFVVHCGDLVDFGLTDEFVWMRDELSHLRLPYIVALGNHDCLGTGKNVFREMYGAFEYSFTAGNTHFVVLNTNGLEFEYTEGFFGVNFLRDNYRNIPSQTERTVVVMHAAMGCKDHQFPTDKAEHYLQSLAPYPNVQFAVCGHEHHTSVRTPIPNHIPYYITACAKERSFLLFHLKSDGTYDYKEVQL